jgi:hypothetical protein
VSGKERTPAGAIQVGNGGAQRADSGSGGGRSGLFENGGVAGVLRQKAEGVVDFARAGLPLRPARGCRRAIACGIPLPAHHPRELGPIGIIASSQVGKRYVTDVGHKKGRKMINTLLQGQDEPQRGLLEEDR